MTCGRGETGGEGRGQFPPPGQKKGFLLSFFLAGESQFQEEAPTDRKRNRFVSMPPRKSDCCLPRLTDHCARSSSTVQTDIRAASPPPLPSATMHYRLARVTWQCRRCPIGGRRRRRRNVKKMITPARLIALFGLPNHRLEERLGGGGESPPPPPPPPSSQE